MAKALCVGLRLIWKELKFIVIGNEILKPADVTDLLTDMKGENRVDPYH
jgi:hypothetical protein